MTNYNQGTRVRLKATFKTFAGAPVDPTTVTFYIQTEADGEWAQYDYDATSDSSSDYDGVERLSTGIYYLDIDTLPQSGVYKWRIYGSGPNANSRQGAFYVEPMDPDDSESSSS
jgi:hypothetical protein